MDIFISKHGENLGPYGIDEIQGMVKSGEVSATDHAWHDGLDEWAPLSRVLALAAPVPSPPAPPSSTESATANSLPEPSAPPRSSKLRSPGSTPPAAAPPREKHPDADVRLRTPDTIVRETTNPNSQHKRGVVAMPEAVHVRKRTTRNVRFSFLRLLAVPAVALMVYAMFLPWAHVEDEDGGVFSRATAAQLSLSEEFATEPLGVENPKTFPHLVRLCMVLALLGILLVSLLCLKLAFRQEGVLPFGPLVISLATVAAVGALGALFGIHLENATHTYIKMDIGYYLALATAVFAVAMILVPEVARVRDFLTLFLPPIIVSGIAFFLFFHGCGVGRKASTSQTTEMGDEEREIEVLRAPSKVIQDIKEYYGKVTG